MKKKEPKRKPVVVKVECRFCGVQTGEVTFPPDTPQRTKEEMGVLDVRCGECETTHGTYKEIEEEYCRLPEQDEMEFKQMLEQAEYKKEKFLPLVETKKEEIRLKIENGQKKKIVETE